KQPGVHQVQRQLTRRVEIISANHHAEAQLLVFAKSGGVVGVEIVATVTSRILERAVGVRPLIGYVSIYALRIGAIREKSSSCIEVCDLEPQRELVRQRFTLADVDHAQSAEIPVLGAEGPVDDLDVLNQLRAERLERTQVALAVTLRTLI